MLLVLESQAMFSHSDKDFLLISLRIQEQPENNFLMFPSPNLPPTCIYTHFFYFTPDTWHHLSLRVLLPCTGCHSFSPTLEPYLVVFFFPFGVIICSFSTGSYRSAYNHTAMISLLKVISAHLISPSSHNCISSLPLSQQN